MTIFESAAITLLDTIFPALAPFVSLADAIYEAETKDPTALDGQAFPFSLKGVKYTVTIAKA